MTTDIIERDRPHDRAVAERQPLPVDELRGYVFGGILVVLALLAVILAVTESRKPNFTVGRSASLVSKLDEHYGLARVTDPAKHKALARRIYLESIDIAASCGMMPTIKVPGQPTSPITYDEARSVNTDWSLVNVPMYMGDHVDRRFGTHCTPGPNMPDFDRRF